MTLDMVWNFLVNHKAVEMLITTALIKTMPVSWADKKIATMYYWVYDGAHQFFNITNTRLTVSTVPTPPANKEELVTVPK